MSQIKHIYYNIFPKIINIFSLPFMHEFFCPGGLFDGPVPSYQGPQCYRQSTKLAGQWDWWTSSCTSYTMGIVQFHRPVVF